MEGRSQLRSSGAKWALTDCTGETTNC